MLANVAWRTDGYVVLPGFYSESEIERFEQARAGAWNGVGTLVVDDLVTGARLMLVDVDSEARRAHRFKVNDQYLENDEIRYAALNQRIVPILTGLLGHRPVLCNSLAFTHGSEQPYHVDSLYMTPRTDGHLIAIWVALEDCDADAGPLLYYPGSHTIPAYHFSNGQRHSIGKEEAAWRGYMDREINTRRLGAQTFAARKGDVFIWSANLLHGGSPIKNPSLTRKSLVFHYLSETDARSVRSPLVQQAGAYWLYKRHFGAKPRTSLGEPAARVPCIARSRICS